MKTWRPALPALVATPGVVDSAHAQAAFLAPNTPKPAGGRPIRLFAGGKGHERRREGRHPCGGRGGGCGRQRRREGWAYVFSGTDGSLLFTPDTPNTNPLTCTWLGRLVALSDVSVEGSADMVVAGPNGMWAVTNPRGRSTFSRQPATTLPWL